MKPKICLSIGNLKEFSFEELDSLGVSFDGFEIRNDLKDRQNIKKLIDNIREPFSNYELSFHSGLGRVFSCTEHDMSDFIEAEISVFKAEIIAAKIAGAKEIVFHFKNGFLSEEEIMRFQEILDFANKNGIKLLVESNTFSQADYILDFLEKFPDVGYCLDMGHVNTSISGDTFGMDLFEFLEKINDRVFHIHFHNNFGEEDSHNSIDEGTFPWKEVLEKLTNVKKIVLENKVRENSVKSKKILDEFY